jgi:hypothetical protein
MVMYDFEITDTSFEPKRAIVTKNAVVSWKGMVPVPMDVTFDNPANIISPPVAVCVDGWAPLLDFFGLLPGPYCGSGNIEQFTGGDGTFFAPTSDGTAAIRQRQFPVPGVYTFHNTFSGATATLEVVDE